MKIPFRLLYAPLLLTLLFARGVRADRVVLAPTGYTLDPNVLKIEGLVNPYRRDENLVWIQYASPQQIELEYNRFDLRNDSKIRHSFNIQYPLLTDLGTYPAISAGVRDLFGTGKERQSFYLAISRSVPLSDGQLKLIRELRWNVGAGTSYISGPFVGLQARFAGGIEFDAEYYKHRPNLSVSLNLVRNLKAKATSLNGSVFYGLTFTLAR